MQGRFATVQVLDEFADAARETELSGFFPCARRPT